MAEKLNRDVDEITNMTYASFLFWNNYFKIEQQQKIRNNGV